MSETPARAEQAPPAAAPSAPPEPAREARVPLGTKLAYGAPSFAGAAMAIPIGIHLTIFYSDTVLIPLGFIALVKALARALDALTDPVMGWITDRTRTRWGRRRPWLVIGAPLCAVAFVGMFTPPSSLDGGGAAAWFAATYILYYLFHTVYVIPHYGLGPELTLDYQERNVLFVVREAFVVLGTLVAAVLPAVLVGSLGERSAYMWFAILFGVLLTLLYLNLAARVKERPDFVNRTPNPLVPGVRHVMRNRAFRLLLCVYVIGATTGAIPGMMVPYFTKYVLRPDDPNRWLAIFLAAYFAAGFVAMPVWLAAANRFGKKATWLASFVPGITGSLGLFTMGPGDVIPTLVVLVWAGVGFSAGLFLGPSMQADVIDYDELYTGKRREAQYGGLWSVITKFVVIPSMSIPLAVLASMGFEPNVQQSPEVEFAIRAIFGLAPMTTGILAFGLAALYPINQDVHRRIWDGIEAHRRGEVAIDPLTGGAVPPLRGRAVDEDTAWFLDHFSRRELGRALLRGPRKLLESAVLGAAIALAITVAGVWSILHEVTGFDAEPGLRAVAWIVAAGFAFTGFCYHAVRVRAARRYARRPPDAAQVRAHLELTELLVRGGQPRRA